MVKNWKASIHVALLADPVYMSRFGQLHVYCQVYIGTKSILNDQGKTVSLHHMCFAPCFKVIVLLWPWLYRAQPVGHRHPLDARWATVHRLMRGV